VLLHCAPLAGKIDQRQDCSIFADHSSYESRPRKRKKGDGVGDISELRGTIFSAEGKGVKTEETWVECENARLFAQLHIPDHVPARAVLVCHFMDARGYHGLEIYTRLAEAACHAGFVSLNFDFRGVGKSTGQFDYGVGEQQDVKCALNYLASRREVVPNSLFVVGHSLGAAVSLYAVQNDVRIKGLALWSPPKNHDYNVKKFIRRTRGRLGLCTFLLFSRLDRVLNISRVFKMEVFGINLRLKDVRGKLMKLDECEVISRLKDLPVLIVIGDSDDIHGLDEAREVYSSAHDPKTLLIIRGANHIYDGKQNELITETMEWIKNLDGQNSRREKSDLNM
jgi:alpha/beta superfamily hydrolase